MKKRMSILVICLTLITVSCLPSIAHNIKNEQGQDDELNLSAEIEPFRKVFSRIYTLLVKAQFRYGYNLENGQYDGGDTLTFQVTRLADNELVYSEIIEMDPLYSSGRGSIVDYTGYSGIRRFVSFYEAKIILNVDDSDPSDNEASCYFIVVETI